MAICGIDLGTTHSLIAVFGDAGPRLIPNALGEYLTPSVVGLDDAGEVILGSAARERLLLHPDRTVASFKRLMGTASETKLGPRSFRLEELSALILRSLREDAEAVLKESIDEVIISVPAYFNDHQRKATLDAGRLAGLTVKRLVNEPTAAALAYGLAERTDGRFLVFDLGGGTFDVSILDKYDGVMEVRATTGDTRLGGNDFTQLVEDLIGRAHEVQPRSLAPVDAARLRREAERVKLALTDVQEVSYNLALGGRVIAGTLSRVAFEAEAAGLLRRLRAPMERAIADARLDPAQLDAVVLVGGATRMPMVRSLVARLFGRMPHVHLDPDTTVGLGAAVQVGLHRRATALEDVVMTDVCPYTLGIAVHDSVTGLDEISPLIERNAVVPISRSGIYSTVRDRQKQIDLKVYQGENLRPADNVLIGELTVPVPPKAAGEEAVEVRFTYDINGALEVEAKVGSTGVLRREVFRNTSGLSAEELHTRFAALSDIKLAPREQAKNKLLLARAERLYSEQVGEERENLLASLREFERAISDQHNRALEGTRATFASVLDSFERSIFHS